MNRQPVSEETKNMKPDGLKSAGTEIFAIKVSKIQK